MTTAFPSHLQQDHATVAAILRPIYERLNHRDEHWVHVIVGREGSGKSHTALKLGEQIDPGFSVGDVYFQPAELLRDLRDGEYSQGDVYILDEAGVGLGKRTWQEAGQKRLNQSLQLIRNHNIGLIFTLPRLSELDSQAQGRLHSYLEIRHKEPGQYVGGPWRWLDPDRVDITGEVYRKTPSHDGTDLKRVKFSPPEDDDLVERYEERKTEFQESFYDETIDTLEGNGEDETADTPDTPHDIAAAIRSDGGVEQYIKEINGGAQAYIDTDEISLDYHVGDPKAKKVKKLLMRDLDRDGLQ